MNQKDPSETQNLASEKPELFRAMKQLYELRSTTTFFFTPYLEPKEECEAYVAAHHGFVGPPLEE